ncbi:hypothetical protein N431DRAFT_421379 [Stipitochalara longipes BDJ]|nr:hypothetical protein N431DRAFT_421379 [Stipitochalara longipes BDJ]
MDALTALSLAGNIIQFVDFGTKLLSRAGELYKSSQGSLRVNDEIELVTADLKSLITKIQVSLLKKDESEDLGDQDQAQSGSFRKVCDEAVKVADELVGRLKKLKINGKHRRLTSLQQAVKTLWNEKEVASLMRRLLTLKETLESHVLLSIRESLDSQSLQASARFKSLDRQTREILATMLDQTTNANKNTPRELREAMSALTVTITQLLSRVEQINQEGHSRTRDEILRKICEREGMLCSVDQIVSGIEMLNVSDASERKLRTSIQESIINSLKYPSMTHRYEDVIEAHPNTFEWAFKNPTEKQLPWSNLTDWLKTGNGVYWVCGKAGSGKSTFLKHIYDQGRTEQLLSVWARDHQLCIATFFFWNSGTREQKSQLGFLRSLLYQVLNQCPELVPLVLPKLWGVYYSKAVRQDWTPDGLDETWALHQLMDALRALVHQNSIPLKLCFLIDGLDEFDGDHEQMGKLFQEITASNKNVKACLSSRPWVVFEYLFGSSPMLRLQNLTYRDIEHYVNNKLEQNDAYQRLAHREPDIAQALVHEIVHKADGVFLWVKLVVSSLLNGIRNRDEMSDLWERLRLLPRELKPLYIRLLELVEPLYLPWVSKAFQILRANRNHIESPFKYPSLNEIEVSPLRISDFLFAINQNINVATLKGRSLQNKCEDILVQLTARCAGFLEVSIKKDKVSKDSLVCYFHRTARDFLETEEIWSKLLLQTSSTDFDPNTAMMRSCIITLQFPCGNRYSVHGTQIALLDQLCSMLTLHDSKNMGYDTQWIIDLIPKGRGLATFVELTTLFDLKAYVREMLNRRDESNRHRLAASLLRCLLPIKDDHVYGSHLPLPGVDMVQLLLQKDADPNGTCDTMNSAWEKVLTYQANMVHESSCLSLTNTNYDARILQRRYIEIMQLLVLSGAHPDARVFDHKRVQLNPIEVVEKILVPRFPLEAAPLLNSLQEKLRKKSATKRKQPCDDGEKNAGKSKGRRKKRRG